MAKAIHIHMTTYDEEFILNVCVIQWILFWVLSMLRIVYLCYSLENSQQGWCLHLYSDQDYGVGFLFP
jgi:hypothetical protein